MTQNEPWVTTRVGKPVAFSPDGQLLASTGDGVSLWRVSDGKFLTKLHGDWTRTVDFSPEGKLIASGSGYGKLSIWGIP